MKIGLQLTAAQVKDIIQSSSKFNTGLKLGELACVADEERFSSLWLPDHLISALSAYGGPVNDPLLEGYCLSGCSNKKIRVGLLVTCNLFMHPALLVKTDHLLTYFPVEEHTYE